MIGPHCLCERCSRPCRVAPDRNPEAKLLRKSAVPKGVCVNCAATEWLMNTYPCNMLLDQSGPEHLRHPAIQEQFAAIMASGMADARPDEIDWEAVIANWDLPIQLKGSAINPYTPTHPRRAPKPDYRPRPSPRKLGPITSIEELNEIEPGLGDQFRKAVDGLSPGRTAKPPEPPPPAKPSQGTLFPEEGPAS
jgi:hypothetical protein